MKIRRQFMMMLVGLATALPTAHARVEYDANQLLMINADQISELVRKKIKKAQDIQAKQEEPDDGSFLAEPAAVEQLKDAMRIVLARPDQDGTRANAFARLRRELVDLNSLDNVLIDLSKEGLASLGSKSTPVTRAYTYIVLLDNLMAEIKPEISTNANFKKIIEDIRDANIQISDQMKSKELMRAMTIPVSPSVTAGKILPKAKK